MESATGELKVNLHQLLRAMIEKGASDLHIATGSPPLLRVDGSVVPLKLPPLGHMAVSSLLWVNFGWGVFNLLPVLPFDGGHVL